MFLDGVLRKDKTAPIRQGLLLYKALVDKQRVVVLCEKKDDAERWFKENKLTKIDDIVSLEDSPVDTEYDLVEHIRSRGNITMVVTPDVELATQLLEKGVNTILFLEPKYIRPEFRPDIPRGAKVWANLVAEMDRQQGLIETDNRLKDDLWESEYTE